MPNFNIRCGLPGYAARGSTGHVPNRDLFPRVPIIPNFEYLLVLEKVPSEGS